MSKATADDYLLSYESPFKILGSISLEGHLLLLSGWLAWTSDGYDYFSVSLTAKLLAKQFDKSTTAIVSACPLFGLWNVKADFASDDSYHSHIALQVSGRRDFR